MRACPPRCMRACRSPVSTKTATPAAPHGEKARKKVDSFACREIWGGFYQPYSAVPYFRENASFEMHVLFLWEGRGPNYPSPGNARLLGRRLSP